MNVGIIEDQGLMENIDDIIRVEGVSYTYQRGTPFEFDALFDVSLSVKKGEILGVLGPTGSGKSTLVQLFNGLAVPDTGRVLVKGRDINQKSKDKRTRSICFEVGLVFQYPEYQLFEETVFDDIAFGPKNMGLNGEKLTERVQKAMEWMDLDYEAYRRRSPFSLSGGEMRRVALAGVLAMEPEILVLDEPAAGLDPKGCRELEELIKKFHRELGMTLVMVTHEIGGISALADRLIILNHGRIVKEGSPRQVFSDTALIEELKMGLPPFMELSQRLKKRGFAIKEDPLDCREAAEALLKLFKKGN